MTGARPGRVWAAVLTAGVLAGLASWLAGEATYGLFKAEKRDVAVVGGSVRQETLQTLNAAALKNTVVATALLAAIVGLFFGLAGGLARGAPRAALTAGVAGLIPGALIGAVLPFPLLSLFFGQQASRGENLFLPLLVHGGLWASVGAVGG